MKLTEKKYKKANEKVLACPQISVLYANTILQRVKLLYSDHLLLRENYENMLQDLIKAINSTCNSMKLIPTKQSVMLVRDAIQLANQIFISLQKMNQSEVPLLDQIAMQKLNKYIQFFWQRKSSISSLLDRFYILIIIQWKMRNCVQ